jgi:transglutaminase-like putative cysteine protease
MNATLLGVRWPGWRHLPREARDVLFLLGVIGWTVLPHLNHLPWWCGALTAVVLVWRALLALSNAALPGRWWVFSLLLLAIGLTLLTHRTLLGKEAGVTMLVVLMVLKTLELRLRRDALVVFFLGFFLVLTNFLYSQSLAIAAAMVVSVWGLLTALVLAHMPVGQPRLRHAGGLAARAALLGAPVMLVLFILFPRFGPLWGLPNDAMPRTGLSGTMRLGSVAEIANDDSIALRIRFLDGSAPPQSELYFRGPVLAHFDGREWRRSDAGPSAGTPLRLIGEPVRYEMTLEPSRLPLLPLLELTPRIAQAAPQLEGWRFDQRDDLQWTSDRLVAERLRFNALAWPRFEYGPTGPDFALGDFLQLPQGYNPRTLAWGEALRHERPGADASALALEVYRHVRRAGYTYTLSPGTYGDEEGRDAVDEFWLDRKQGFCEHFAAAFVVVMRAAGVPARIVTGYQGADLEPLDGYTVVRQSHAHAWAEYWQAGRGWQRADPTAAVAPDRIVRSRQLSPQLGLVAGALGSMSPELLAGLRAAWEITNNRWNQWVLNYSRSEQFDLLRRLGVQAPNWADLALLLIVLISGAALAGAGWAFWDRRRQDPWQRLHARVRERLAALGIECAPHDAPRTLARRLRSELGAPADALAAELDALDRGRYGRGGQRRPDPRWWRGFARAAAALTRKPSLR